MRNKYKLSSLEDQDKLNEGLVRINDRGYLRIEEIVVRSLCLGKDYYFLPFEEQDKLNKGYLKFRDKLAERNLFGPLLIRLIYGEVKRREYGYLCISNLEIDKLLFSKFKFFRVEDGKKNRN